jgi:hypothetical protein
MDYNNTDLRPKTFYVQIERQRNGEFRVKRASMLEKANQHSRNLRRIDARDFTRALRNSSITVA